MVEDDAPEATRTNDDTTLPAERAKIAELITARVSHTRPQATRKSDETTLLAQERTRIVRLIAARAQERQDRYADLRSRCRSSAASELVFQVYRDISDWEQKNGKRIRRRRAKSGVPFVDALRRFVGDLLRARTGKTSTGRIYRSTGKSSFKDDPVKYDVFMRVLESLKALALVGHRKGQTRSIEIAFSPGNYSTIPGRAARFWPTPKLLKLAGEYGIRDDNVLDHFGSEPPRDPLVLRDHGTGRGRNKERGRVIKDYPRTPHTKRLEADVRELNEFLSRVVITGGRHEGYTRNFNLRSWKKGGRLSSAGQNSYQQLPEQRYKMTINGEPVVEIDIKASHLTIYHAKLGTPLDGASDPYLRAGVDRSIAKQWMIISFGNSRPATRWPAKTIEDYKKDTGKDLRKVAKASDVGRKMLTAFPALRKLENCSDIWADLQFIESEAVISTMLVLMHKHGVPSLSMHDGIIVPKSKAELAKRVLSQQYRHFVGVRPMLTVEPEIVRAEDL